MTDRIGVDMTDRTCVDCTADISGRHHNAKRCEVCAKAQTKVTMGAGTRTKACSVEDNECNAGRLRHGMCERHYRRFKTTGTTDVLRVDHLTRFTVGDGGCWLWTGPMFWNGYGHISEATFGTTLAHRAFYAAHRGPIPPDADLDHLCRVRHCVNPDHLEPVTHSVNIQRGHDARMNGYCNRGHDQSLPNARWIEPCTGRTYCRKCKSIREREGRQRRNRAA